MREDAELLGLFAQAGDQAAFAELVGRHVNLVYSAAVRQVGGDDHLAQDVTQEVFRAMAVSAEKLSARDSLTGWLYSTTRNLSRMAVRTHHRWRQREKEANMIRESLPDRNVPEWSDLGPVLDDAMHELSESDREAILLRYFENRSFSEVGRRLGVMENSARMRVDRALDKLRLRLARRGIVSTAAALGTALSGQTVAVAPAGLVTAASAVWMAAAAPLGAGAATSVMVFMSKTKLLAGAVALVVLLGIGAWSWNQNRAALVTGAEVKSRVESEVLRAEIRRLRQDLVGAQATAGGPQQSKVEETAAPAPGAPVKFTSTAGMRRTWATSNLLQLREAATKFRADNGRPPTGLGELVGENLSIRKLEAADGESYDALDFSTPTSVWAVTTASGEVISHDPASAEKNTPWNYEAARQKAQEAYRAAHNGLTTTGPELLPFFEDPVWRTDHVNFLKITALVDHMGPAAGPAMTQAAHLFQAAHENQMFSAFEDYPLLAPYIADEATRKKLLEGWARIREAGP